MADSVITDSVFALLRDAGTRLKADVWQPSDLGTLRLIAQDLVGLDEKAKDAAATGDDRRRYGEAAARLLDHAALLALSRMNVANNDVLEALKSYFLDLAKRALPLLLAALAKLI